MLNNYSHTSTRIRWEIIVRWILYDEQEFNVSQFISCNYFNRFMYFDLVMWWSYWAVGYDNGLLLGTQCLLLVARFSCQTYISKYFNQSMSNLCYTRVLFSLRMVCWLAFSLRMVCWLTFSLRMVCWLTFSFVNTKLWTHNDVMKRNLATTSYITALTWHNACAKWIQYIQG